MLCQDIDRYLKYKNQIDQQFSDATFVQHPGNSGIHEVFFLNFILTFSFLAQNKQKHFFFFKDLINPNIYVIVLINRLTVFELMAPKIYEQYDAYVIIWSIW